MGNYRDLYASTYAPKSKNQVTFSASKACSEVVYFYFPANPSFCCSASYFRCDFRYSCSTFSLAHGVLLKNFKLDLMEGS